MQNYISSCLYYYAVNWTYFSNQLFYHSIGKSDKQHSHWNTLSSRGRTIQNVFAKTVWLFNWLFSLKIITGCRLNMTEVERAWVHIFRDLDNSGMMHIVVSLGDQLPFWPPVYNSGPHMFLQSFSCVIVNKKISFTLCMIASIIVDYLYMTRILPSQSRSYQSSDFCVHEYTWLLHIY